MSEVEELQARIEEYKKVINQQEREVSTAESQVYRLEKLLELNNKWMDIVKDLKVVHYE